MPATPKDSSCQSKKTTARRPSRTHPLWWEAASPTDTQPPPGQGEFRRVAAGGPFRSLRCVDLEGLRDISQVEVRAVSFGDFVNAVQVPDHMVFDKGVDGAKGNWQGSPLHLGPLRIQTGVAKNVDCALALGAMFLG